MRILRVFFVFVLANLALNLFADDADIEARVASAAARLRSADPEVRENARKEIELLGTPALPAVRKLRTAETNVEARKKLAEIEEVIEIEDLSAGTWKSSWEVEPLEGMILRCVVSPDGKRAVTEGTDRRLLLWDCEDAKVLKSLGNAGFRETVVFSPDGKILAACSGDSDRVRVWNSVDGAELSDWDRTELGDVENTVTLGRHASGATVLSDSSGGLALSSTSFLASGARSPSGHWYVGEGGQRIGVLRCVGIDASNHMKICFTLRDAVDLKVIAEHRWTLEPSGGTLDATGQFAFDGTIAAFNDGGVLRTIDAESGNSLHSFGEGILHFAQSGEDWVSVHEDGSVRTWRDGKEIQRFDPGPAEFPEIQVSPTTILVLSSCLDSRRMHVNGASNMVAFDRKSGRELVKATECVEARLRENWLEVREVSGRLRVWRDSVLVKETSAEKAFVIELTSSRVFTPSSGTHDWLAYPSEGKFVVTCHSTGSSFELKGGHHGFVGKMVAHERGVLAVTSGNSALLDNDGKIVTVLETWNAEIVNGHVVPPAALLAAWPQGPIEWSLNGARFAVVAGKELLVTSADGSLVWKCPREVTTGDLYALSVDGKLLAAAWSENHEPVIKLWRVGEASSIADVRPGKKSGETRMLQFSADGRELVAAMDQLLLLTTGGTQIAVINHWPETLFMEGAGCWRFSPDGSRIGCINGQGELAVYESATGKELGKLRLEAGIRRLSGRVEFSPDSHWAFFLDDGSTLHAIDRDGAPNRDFAVEVSGFQQPFAWSGDGSLFVLTRKGLQIFHQATLRAAATFPDLAGDGIAVSPNGRRIFLSKDSVVHAWDR